eukprot:2239031-Amphidinium_carterae.1
MQEAAQARDALREELVTIYLRLERLAELPLPKTLVAIVSGVAQDQEVLVEMLAFARAKADEDDKGAQVICKKIEQTQDDDSEPDSLGSAGEDLNIVEDSAKGGGRSWRAGCQTWSSTPESAFVQLSKWVSTRYSTALLARPGSNSGSTGRAGGPSTQATNTCLPHCRRLRLCSHLLHAAAAFQLLYTRLPCNWELSTWPCELSLGVIQLGLTLPAHWIEELGLPGPLEPACAARSSSW